MLYNWQTRINNADQAYKEWSNKYRCSLLEDYFRGFQWRNKKDIIAVNYNPYTLNLVFSTIQIKLANFIFQKPSFVVTPAAGHSEFDLDMAVRGAYVKQDILNTIVKDKRTLFTQRLKLAARDSFFRFGLIEVGYAADWRNPSTDQPHLKSWDKDETDSTEDRLIKDESIPYNERFYVKRIRPSTFRTAISLNSDLSEIPWCGYFDYVSTAVLKKTSGIRMPKSTIDSTYVSREFSSGIVDDTSGSTNEEVQRLRRLSDGAVSKVWHIFDSVANKRYLFLDKMFDEPLWEEDCYRLPLVDFRWIPDFSGFYPIPPVWYWISPQDEINEAREQTRSYRRRFTRKFQVVRGQCAPEEQEKFTSGPDGTLIEVNQADAISPIQNPEQGPTAENALIIAKDDFNIVSATSANTRGQADRETATAAKIVDARSAIRESAEQIDFGVYVAAIGHEILTQVHEKMSEGMMVKMTQSPDGSSLVNGVWQYISASEVRDGYDFEVDIDVQNATPAAMAATQQAFIQFLTLMRNFPELTMDTDLIREAAYRVGYRNERVIQKYQKAAQAKIAAQQAAAGAPNAQQHLDNQGDNAAKATLGQMATPESDVIDKQLGQQMNGGMLQ